ncbi:MAG TPA: CAP domain-containing protein [Anaerolineae bacterium]|nr:CAP domain-containing protein [Anaerolineae bacterium]
MNKRFLLLLSSVVIMFIMIWMFIGSQPAVSASTPSRRSSRLDTVTRLTDRALLTSTLAFTAYLPLVIKQPAAPPATNWLDYVNYYRALANLPSVTENPIWSDGDWKHGRYMVKNDFIGHDEDPANPWYTPEGRTAAQNGNTMVSSSATVTDSYAIDFWMRAPFHAVGILDPALGQIGFGSYREADGGWQMGATLDVIRGLGAIPPAVAFPIEYPGDGATIGLRSYTGGEWPDPLSSCAGYTTPSGLPIILQIGPGNLMPSVTTHSFKQSTTSLEHCIFDETNYVNPDSTTQGVGRSVLNARDAIVLIPRSPLTAGATYTVSIATNGQTYTWAFTVASTATVNEFAGPLSMR